SRHAGGRRYTFVRPWLGRPLPDCPAPLRRLVIPPEPPPGGPGGGIGDLDRYARAALDGEVRRIRGAPRPVIRDGRRVAAGGRNNAVHLAAFRLGQLAAEG